MALQPGSDIFARLLSTEPELRKWARRHISEVASLKLSETQKGLVEVDPAHPFHKVREAPLQQEQEGGGGGGGSCIKLMMMMLYE